MTDLATSDQEATTDGAGPTGATGTAPATGAARATAAARAAGPGSTGPAGLEDQLERHRVELTGYCYRMLGSGFEAEDAVQETMVRAWRGLARFEGDREALRPWLYRIATNVCLTLLSRRQRRAQPVDLGPGSVGERSRPGGGRPGGGGAGVAVAGGTAPVGATTVWPVPDALVLPDGDPAETAVARESIRLAFVTALQHLGPRQRAVLILRDVLRWRAREVADLLDTSTASVNSTLQRARGVLAGLDVGRDGAAARAGAPPQLQDDEQRELLDRYVAAFERFDVESLVTLLHADATMTMPPHPLSLHGRLDICRFWLEEGDACRGSLLVPTVANGSPAFGSYRPSGPDGRYEPFAVQVLEIADGRIAGIHTFIDPHLLPLFGLPAEPPQASAA